MQGAGALGPQPDLCGGLFTGDVEGTGSRMCPLRSNFEQQCGLADARFASQQEDGAGDNASTENPIEFAHARCRGLGLGDVDRRNGLGWLADGGGFGAAGALGAGHVDRAPGLAFTAAADPFAGRPAAFGTLVGRSCGLRGCRHR